MLPLMSCAGLESKADAPAFRIPSRPKAKQPFPVRPQLFQGDVVGGLIEGEVSPRICFRPERWQEVLAYIINLETYSRVQSEQLRIHIEKLERQITQMNRILKTDR